MRDRDPIGLADPVPSTIDKSDFDELLLFAVDTGDGLIPEECEAVARFRRSGRGMLVTRDYMDIGSSIRGLDDLGKVHYFHSYNLDLDAQNRVADDPYSTPISWPIFTPA